MTRTFIVAVTAFGTYMLGLCFFPKLGNYAFGIGGFGVSWLLIGAAVAGIVALRNT